MHCRWYPSMSCSRSPEGGAWSWGGLLWVGCLVPGGSAPWGVAFCYGLLLWSSVMPFWFGGLLIEGGLLVWSSGGQKVITEGHHPKGTTPEGHNRRPPHQKAPHQKAPHQKATRPEGHHSGLVETPPTPDSYCCGQYASYWNAFL